MDQENTSENTSSVKMSIPIAIVFAGIVIAGAIILVGGTGAPEGALSNVENAIPKDSEKEIALAPITAKDHFLGARDAKITIVEFSDLECPFCKTFHNTMKQIIKEYGDGGEVAWVYRHFPLENIHPNARKEAEATECASELGGDVKFWEFTDALFDLTASNNALESESLSKIAKNIGINEAKFDECVSSGRTAALVSADIEEALGAGAQGTPYSIVLLPNGEKPIPLFGARPYDEIKKIIDSALETEAQ